jgi:hypothetical protein
MLAGDCCSAEKKDLDHIILPKATVDVETGMRTFKFLQKQHATGMRILFGRDGVQWKGVVEGAGME